MARKKNIVKSAPNSLRQALLAVKTAILNFSPEHILFLSYEPSSKAMTVKDIPANLESQFTLGESGGEGLSPKVTITLKPTGCGAYCLNDGISTGSHEWFQIADGHIYYATNDQNKWNLIEENSSGTFNTYAVMIGSNFMVNHTLLPIIPEDNSYAINSVSIEDLVNCVNDNGITITDPTREASFTMYVHFENNIG